MKELKIFGLRPVIEAIESKRPIDKVWIVKSINSKLHVDLTSKLKKNNIPFSLVPKQAIERKLRDTLDIPIFHDDQHGTAIITSAALINALDISNKKPGDV